MKKLSLSAALILLLCTVCFAGAGDNREEANFSEASQTETALFGRAAEKYRSKFQDLLKTRGYSRRHTYDFVVSPKYLAETLKTFPAGTALLFYDFDEEGLHAWLMDKKGIRAAAHQPLPSSHLADAIFDLRISLGIDSRAKSRAPRRRGKVVPIGGHGERRKPLANSISGLSHILLPRKIATGLHQVRHLIVVPVLGIGTVPFSLLQYSGAHSALVEHMSICIAPSLMDIQPQVPFRTRQGEVVLSIRALVLNRGDTVWRTAALKQLPLELEVSVFDEAAKLLGQGGTGTGEQSWRKEKTLSSAGKPIIPLRVGQKLRFSIRNSSDRAYYCRVNYVSCNGEQLALFPYSLVTPRAERCVGWEVLLDQEGIETILLLVTPETGDIYPRDDMLSRSFIKSITRRKHWRERGSAFRGPLVVGNPRYSKEDEWIFPDLPGAATEATVVAEMLKANAILGGAATSGQVKPRMKSSDLLYFATHGIADSENPMEGSFLALTPEGGDPGRLTAHEIQSMQLDAYLSVLSACQTGLGKTHDAGIIGLARAFYLAGVSSVVMSLWNVNDRATSDLMQLMFKKLANNPPAEALRKAMLKMRKKTADPALWASFVVLGVN